MNERIRQQEQCELCGAWSRPIGMAKHRRKEHTPCPFGCGSYVGLKMHLTKAHEKQD